MQLSLETVDFRSIVLAALETVEKATEDRKQNCRLDLTDERCFVKGDPARLEQVLSNLLQNASKYTDCGGHITVSMRKAAHDVVVAVKDDGIGIAPDELPGLFQLFVQGRTARARERRARHRTAP